MARMIGGRNQRSAVSGQRQFETARHNARHGNVFVQLFPTQGVAIEAEFDLVQLGGGRRLQTTKSIRRKTHDSSVGEFDVNSAFFNPNPQGG